MKRKPFLSRICLKNVILQILKLSDLHMYLSVNLANIVTINQNVIRQNKKKNLQCSRCIQNVEGK